MMSVSLLRLGRIGAAAVAVWLLCGRAAAGPAADEADASGIELDEVVVSAPSAKGRLRGTPHGVSVITSADIERSTATGLADVISREAGLNLQSFFGADKKTTVDIRGMGATASSNVQVLVDGVRLNEIDLSGADLGVLSLDQIERIEVLRGGGAVRYGNGAVGGVIHITTKRPQPGAAPRIDAQVSGGSYGAFGWSSRLAAAAGDWAADIKLSDQSSDGYRDNGGGKSRDAGVELRWLPQGVGPVAEVFLRASSHNDHTGLPGAVIKEAFYGSEAARRASSAPFDFSDTNDNRTSLGVQLDLGALGGLRLSGTVRDRTNPYLLGYSGVAGGSPNDPNGWIESSVHEWALHYHTGVPAWGQQHAFDAGVEARQADALRIDHGLRVDGSERHVGAVDARGMFAEAKLGLGTGWTAMLGFRKESFETQQRSSLYATTCQWVGMFMVPGSCVGGYDETGARGGTWRNHGAEVGLTWQITPAVSTFISRSRHFRNPNVDELVQAADDLRPQRGTTSEWGLRYGEGVRGEASLTVFQMKNKDEIFFNPLTNLNANYTQTARRVGWEADGRWQVLEPLILRASVGRVRPEFVDAGGGDIPLVPRLTASTEADWAVATGLHLLAAVRYVGSRLDGSDSAVSHYDRLPAYAVCDVAVRLNFGQTRWSLAINNVGDRRYSTLAYAENFYPMPGRNVRLTASVHY